MRRAVLFAASVIALAACSGGEGKIPGLRLSSKSYRITITPAPLPPRASEDTRYTVTVSDRDNDEPVQTGEGQIYGQLRPGPDGRPRTWDSFTYGPEVGTYHAKVRFAIASITGSADEAWQM